MTRPQCLGLPSGFSVWETAFCLYRVLVLVKHASLKGKGGKEERGRRKGEEDHKGSIMVLWNRRYVINVTLKSGLIIWFDIWYDLVLMIVWVSVKSVEQQQCRSKSHIYFYIKTPVNHYWPLSKLKGYIYCYEEQSFLHFTGHYSLKSTAQEKKPSGLWPAQSADHLAVRTVAPNNTYGEQTLITDSAFSGQDSTVNPCQHSLILNFITVPLWVPEYIHVTADP